MAAVISKCGLYRWILDRYLAGRRTGPKVRRGTVLWVMLNPSTADASLDDPTIRRVKDFSFAWGFCKLQVVNLYALRATNPDDLWVADDPVGAENDGWLYEASQQASMVVLGWGKNAKPERVAAVVSILSVHNPVLYCLGTNKDGSPKHPLYLAKTTQLQAWEQAA